MATRKNIVLAPKLPRLGPIQEDLELKERSSDGRCNETADRLRFCEWHRQQIEIQQSLHWMRIK